MATRNMSRSFFTDQSVLDVAAALLGKVLVTELDGQRCSGMITECEAYTGEQDRAAHVYGGRRTSRTEAMYALGGHAYVYLCYGIHNLLNVVTGPEGIPQAVLLRSLEPLEGVPVMLERRKKPRQDHTLTRGPGSLAAALGITRAHNGTDLRMPPVWLEDQGIKIAPEHIQTGPRIGVAYAGEDALLPYRFWIQDHPSVSKAPVYSSVV